MASRTRALDHAPKQTERLIRVEDSKRFDVVRVSRIEGGELHFTMWAADGECLFVGLDDLFPPLRQSPPFQLVR